MFSSTTSHCIKKFIPHALFIALAMYALTLAIPFSAFRWDGLHWGSVIAASLEICGGAIPFKDVPIYYGPVFFYAYCTVGTITNFSYLSAGIFTFLCYSVMLYAYGAIGLKVGMNGKAVSLFWTVCFILHPFPIYPWYDYFSGMCLAGGILILVGSLDQRVIYRLGLAGCLLAISILARSSFIIPVATLMVLLVILRVVSNRDISVICVGGLVTAAVFFFLMHYFYKLSPIDVFTYYLQSLSHMTKNFPPINLFTKWVDIKLATSIPGMFVLGFYMAALYLIIEVLKANHMVKLTRLNIALLLSSFAGLTVQHIPEFYRFVCIAAPILLFTIQAVTASFAYFVSPPKKASITSLTAYCIIIALSITVTITLVLRLPEYPYITSKHEIEPNKTLASIYESNKNWIVSGVRFYDSQQYDFYNTAERECAGSDKIINLTGDAMISAVCRDGVFVAHDWLGETAHRIQSLQPATYERLKHLQIAPGEVAFAYHGMYPPSSSLIKTHIFANSKSDFHNHEIAIIHSVGTDAD